MQAVRLNPDGEQTVTNVTVPQATGDEVLIQVLSSSMDGTDLEQIHGRHRHQPRFRRTVPLFHWCASPFWCGGRSIRSSVSLLANSRIDPDFQPDRLLPQRLPDLRRIYPISFPESIYPGLLLSKIDSFVGIGLMSKIIIL